MLTKWLKTQEGGDGELCYIIFDKFLQKRVILTLLILRILMKQRVKRETKILESIREELGKCTSRFTLIHF